MRTALALVLVAAAAPLHAAPGDHLFTIEDPEGRVLFGSHRFAASLAGLGTNVIVGAPPSFAYLERGVYLFDQAGQLVREISDPAANGSSSFGHAVAGNAAAQTILVGAPGSGLGSSAGPTYLFDAVTGEDVLSLLPRHRSFGTSVAFFGAGNILVGAPGQDRVYAFDSAGVPLFTLAPPGPIEEFGRSMAGTDDTIVVGSRGAAFLFDSTSGELRHTITVTAPALAENFAQSVAAIERGLVIGAPSPANPSQGVIFVVDEFTAEPLVTIENPNPTDAGVFGTSVAAHGKNIAAAAPGFGNDYIYIFDSTAGLELLSGADVCGSNCSFAATDTGLLVGHSSLVLTALQTVEGFAGIGDYVCDVNGDGACTPTDLRELTNIPEINRWLLTAGMLNIGTAYRRGDIDLDGDFDRDDYVAWKAAYGATDNPAADANGNGTVDAADYTVWRNNAFSSYVPASSVATLSAPEPNALSLLVLGTLCLLFKRHTKKP
jgi:hypothetical protein